MAAIQMKSLSELNFESINFSLVAVIIGKSEPKYFKLKQESDNFQKDERGIITFTIRDSKMHFTNCKFWGTQQKIEEYNRIFHINDVIIVICAKIVPISLITNPTSIKFQPVVSMPFYLVVNERVGHIEQCENSSDTEELKNLLKFPIKPLNNALNLADISSNNLQNLGKYVDLLVLIRFVKPVRSVQMRNGQLRQCLEVIVVDKSLTSGLSLTIWNNEWIQRAINNWHSLSTVLHLIDVRVGYSSFYKSTVLGFSGKTIITENPIGKEVDSLLNFVNSIQLSETNFYEEITGNLPDLKLITTIMTVQQIYDRAEGHLMDDNEQFTAVLYAMITKFDLDGSSRIISKKCAFCNRYIKINLNYCENDQCQMAISFENTTNQKKFEYFFDINVHLTDHTGTLIECRLYNKIAEKLLGITAKEFLQLTNYDKLISIKWKYLMERFEFKLIIKKKSVIRKNLNIILLDLNEINLNDVIDKILVY